MPPLSATPPHTSVIGTGEDRRLSLRRLLQRDILNDGSAVSHPLKMNTCKTTQAGELMLIWYRYICKSTIFNFVLLYLLTRLFLSTKKKKNPLIIYVSYLKRQKCLFFLMLMLFSSKMVIKGTRLQRICKLLLIVLSDMWVLVQTVSLSRGPSEKWLTKEQWWCHGLGNCYSN